jgi:hypothetical protein
MMEELGDWPLDHICAVILDNMNIIPDLMFLLLLKI